jgi:HEAT repeat protein
MLDEDDAYVRVNAAKALWQLHHDKAAVPVLSAGLRDRRAITRIYAAEALWQVNRHGAAVPALIAATQDDSATARYASTRALGRIGPGAKPAVAALRELLGDEDPWVRATAAEALQKIEPQAAAGDKQPR